MHVAPAGPADRGDRREQRECAERLAEVGAGDVDQRLIRRHQRNRDQGCPGAGEDPRDQRNHHQGRELRHELRVLGDAVGVRAHGDRRVAAQERRGREHQRGARSPLEGRERTVGEDLVGVLCDAVLVARDAVVGPDDADPKHRPGDDQDRDQGEQDAVDAPREPACEHRRAVFAARQSAQSLPERWFHGSRPVVGPAWRRRAHAAGPSGRADASRLRWRGRRGAAASRCCAPPARPRRIGQESARALAVHGPFVHAMGPAGWGHR